MKNAIKFLFSCLICIFVTISSVAVVAELVAPNGAKELSSYKTSWIGNSFGGMRDGKGHWVQQDIAAICVTDDGTVYTNVPWEEAGGNCSMYKDGDMLGHAGHTHGWGYGGGKAVAANSKYVFISLKVENENGGLVDPETWPTKGFQWYGISRRLRSDFTKGAPFESGKGGKGDTLPKSFLLINEVSLDAKDDDGNKLDLDNAAISGLWADEERLYVSNPHTNAIEIYDTESMKKLDSWDLSKLGYFEPGQIAADHHGNYWVSHKEKQTRTMVPHITSRPPIVEHIEVSQITQFSQQGEKLVGKVLSPGPFCFASKGRLVEAERMYVFDPYTGIVEISLDYTTGENPAGDPALGDGLSMLRNPNHRRLLGMTNPMNAMSPFFCAPGEFDDLRFDRYGVKAIGCDGEGHLYIAQDIATSGGGAILESHEILSTSKTGDHPHWKNETRFPKFADTKLQWRLYGLCFIDLACLDPDDETIAYTKDEKYKLDWSKGQGKEWSFIGTVYPDKLNPEQKRLGDSAGVWVRDIGGRKKLFLLDMNNQWLRMQDAEFGDNMEQLAGIEQRKHREVVNKPKGRELFYGNSVSIAGPHRDFFLAWYSMEELKDEEDEIKRLMDYYPETKDENPPAQGWWVDKSGGVWRASETKGIRHFPCEVRQNNLGTTIYETYYHSMSEFPHPAEFSQVKRIRYDVASDTLYLGGCGTTEGKEHKNQHWKPMGPLVCRYDNFLKGKNPGKTEGKLAWKIVLPYVSGSSGHESCEPMGFDIAGDYMFVPYTGASKEHGIKTGRVEVYRLKDGQSVGWMEPDQKTVGEIGLQDIRECLSAYRRKNGEYVVFLEDDYKAKIIMYRLDLP